MLSSFFVPYKIKAIESELKRLHLELDSFTFDDTVKVENQSSYEAYKLLMARLAVMEDALFPEF